MRASLPTRLGLEPIIDVIFEMRFESVVPASDILPAYIFKTLPGSSKIERLNFSEIPKPIRDGDPNLRFAPTVKVHGSSVQVSVGDRVLVVGCKLPYPGWKMFRQVIQDVLNVVSSLNVIDTVSRYSLKYVDLIPGKNAQEQIEKVAISLDVAGHKLSNQSFNLSIEIPDADVVHLLTIVAPASVTLIEEQKAREGAIIDVDSIVHLKPMPFDTWYSQLDAKLEELHDKNKQLFFSSITDDTLEELEPKYV